MANMANTRVEMVKQFVKVTLSVVTMMILLLATKKMQILTECIANNMKMEKVHHSSEPIVPPNCKVLQINETMPPFTMQLCDRDLSLYIADVLLEKFLNVDKWVWPIPGKCLPTPSDNLLCNSKNGTNIIVNGIRLSVYETKMLYMFVNTHVG